MYVSCRMSFLRRSVRSLTHERISCNWGKVDDGVKWSNVRLCPGLGLLLHMYK